jgi:hypothetical protein
VSGTPIQSMHDSLVLLQNTSGGSRNGFSLEIINTIVFPYWSDLHVAERAGERETRTNLFRDVSVKGHIV